MPFFRPGPGPYALALAMTGVRMGERLLAIGSGTPALFGTLATKVGLSGRAVAVAADTAGADALKAAGAEAGALVEIEVARPDALPFDAASFDLIVVDCTALSPDNAAPWLREAFRVLRVGGRLIVAEGGSGRRLLGMFRAAAPSGDAEAATRVLQAHGFHPVRKIAERDGWRFTEGLKRGN